nr:cupin domain-containing protein [Brucella anthropi]
MSPVLIHIENESAFSEPVAVGAPVGEQIAFTRTAGNVLTPAGNAGIWECTPGRFRRQVAQAEYSYFIEGEGSFTPDDGKPVEFRAGDSIYFAANAQGEWDIRQTVRKAYLILTD